MSDLYDQISNAASFIQGEETVGDSLCSRCSYGIVFQQKSKTQVTARCTKSFDNAFIVPTDITACTGYSARNELSLNQLADMALIIDPRPMPGQHI